jgi:hypothetical protein
MLKIADDEVVDALEHYVEELQVDVIKGIFTDHSLADLQELLEHHIQRENYNICIAIRDCIQDKSKDFYCLLA